MHFVHSKALFFMIWKSTLFYRYISTRTVLCGACRQMLFRCQARWYGFYAAQINNYEREIKFEIPSKFQHRHNLKHTFFIIMFTGRTIQLCLVKSKQNMFLIAHTLLKRMFLLWKLYFGERLNLKWEFLRFPLI